MKKGGHPESRAIVDVKAWHGFEEDQVRMV